MRNLIWLVLLFAVAVAAALAFGDNRALASFYWQGWRLDLSLNLFVALVLGTALVLWGAARVIGNLISLPEEARAWRNLKRERALQSALRTSLAEFFAGRYSRAHKAARRVIDLHDEVDVLRGDAEFHQLAHLMAAASLHRLQDRGRRDALVADLLHGQASRGGRHSTVTDGARLMAAEWALEDQDAARAEELLAELPAGVSRRTQALRLKLRMQRLAGRPLDALHTARLLANHQGFSRSAAQGLLRTLAFEALSAARDIDQLRRTWLLMDTADHRDPFVAAHAARQAVSLGAPEEARRWLRPAWEALGGLEADARATVGLALLDAVSGIGADWLPAIEAAQRAHPADPAVQAAAGAVYAECALWGKARAPLEHAAAAEPLQPRARRQAWRLLARIASQEGDAERAARCLAAAAAID